MSMYADKKKERDEFIIELAKEGHTLIDIAHWTQSSVSTVQRVLKDQYKPRRQMQAERVEQILALRESGYRAKEISEEVGVGVDRVYQVIWMNRHG